MGQKLVSLHIHVQTLERYLPDDTSSLPDATAHHAVPPYRSVQVCDGLGWAPLFT